MSFVEVFGTLLCLRPRQHQDEQKESQTLPSSESSSSSQTFPGKTHSDTDVYNASDDLIDDKTALFCVTSLRRESQQDAITTDKGNKRTLETEVHRIQQHQQPREPETEAPVTFPQGSTRQGQETIHPGVSSKRREEGQSRLLLRGKRQPYELVSGQEIPELIGEREVLIRVDAIGLNPIDWKAPDFGFAIPSLPCVSGREFVGTVVETRGHKDLRVKKGDIVIVPSTDYRDYRKSAFQEYSIAADSNICKVPAHIHPHNAAAVGVAFVAASLALLVSMGMQFPSPPSPPTGGESKEKRKSGAAAGPALMAEMRAKLKREDVPEDVREECWGKINLDEGEGAREGDLLVIWGASSATAIIALQLASRAGLRVICIANSQRHSRRLLALGAFRVVDDTSQDPQSAVREVRSVVDANEGRAVFGLDTRGKETAGYLIQCVDSTPGHDDDRQKRRRRAHIVGLTGLPKQVPDEEVVLHSVPIKLFHEIPFIGETLMSWLEELLVSGQLILPEVETVGGGLGGVNAALDRLRSWQVSGKRLVVPLV